MTAPIRGPLRGVGGGAALLTREERVLRQLVRTPQSVDTALEARIAALEATMAAVLAALAGAGIEVGVGSSLDFADPDNSGLLTLYSVGG